MTYQYQWTEERKSRAIALWQEGKSGSEIARELGGTTRNAVIGVIHRTKNASRSVHAKRGPRYVPAAPRKKILKPKQNPWQSPAKEILKTHPVLPLPATDATIPNITFTELEPHHCRAIPVDVQPFDQHRKMYCGCTIVAGTSWCETHLRRYAVPIHVAKANAAPSWRNNPIGGNGVFGTGREKMKAY